jgi:predicted transcriptional regulator
MTATATASDPRVQYAIIHSYQRRSQKRNRQTVAEALEQNGTATLAELCERTGLDRQTCGAALDELRIAGLVTAEDGWFGWIK